MPVETIRFDLKATIDSLSTKLIENCQNTYCKPKLMVVTLVLPIKVARSPPMPPPPPETDLGSLHLLLHTLVDC